MEQNSPLLRYEPLGLRNAITHRGLSLKTIEAAIGVSGGYLTRLLQGKRTTDVERARRIAALLDADFGSVFCLTGESRDLWDAYARGERLTLCGPDAAFWSKVKIEPVDPAACWEWQGYRNPHGYGCFNLWKNHRLAHRVAYEIAFGPITDGIEVCHACDQPSCVNPNHLFIGTHADNMADMKQKGRSANKPCIRFGESNPHACLTDDRAAEMVARYRAGGISQRALAAEYGVSSATVWYRLKH